MRLAMWFYCLEDRADHIGMHYNETLLFIAKEYRKMCKQQMEELNFLDC